MVASSYLSYGGVLSVVRADDDDLKNAFAGVTTSSIKIRSVEDYTNNGYDENTITDVVVAARNPGSWGNDVKVCIIDNVADQILTVGTGHSAEVGYGISMDVPSATYQIGAGSTSVLDGFYKGIVTEKDDTQISVKFISHVSAAGTETAKDYEPLGTFSFPGTGTLSYINVGTGTAIGTESVTAQKDWYDQQTVQLTNSTIQWSQLADRPGTSNFAAARSSRFDEVHVVVIDDVGEVTGNAGTILEKHLSMSKAKDGEYSLGSPSYWRKYTYNNSTNIFAGGAPAGIVTTSFASGTFTLSSDVGWDQNAQGINFAGIGATTLTLSGGKNYDGGTDDPVAGSYSVTYIIALTKSFLSGCRRFILINVSVCQGITLPGGNSMLDAVMMCMPSCDSTAVQSNLRSVV